MQGLPEPVIRFFPLETRGGEGGKNPGPAGGKTGRNRKLLQIIADWDAAGVDKEKRFLL